MKKAFLSFAIVATTIVTIFSIQETKASPPAKRHNPA